MADQQTPPASGARRALLALASLFLGSIAAFLIGETAFRILGLKALRGRDSASLWVHSSDLHPNEKAQALVAPALADFVHLRVVDSSNGPVVAK